MSNLACKIYPEPFSPGCHAKEVPLDQFAGPCPVKFEYS